MKFLHSYCYIEDLTICMKCCLLPQATQDADALLFSGKLAAEEWAGFYSLPWLMCQISHFHLLGCFSFSWHLIDELFFCCLLNPVIMCDDLTELVTIQDLGTHKERKGYFTLPAIFRLVCLCLLRKFCCCREKKHVRGLSQIHFAHRRLGSSHCQSQDLMWI